MAGETGDDPVTFRVRAGRATNYATRQLNSCSDERVHHVLGVGPSLGQCTILRLVISLATGHRPVALTGAVNIPVAERLPPQISVGRHRMRLARVSARRRLRETDMVPAAILDEPVDA